jgi:invasion protein IalB
MRKTRPAAFVMRLKAVSAFLVMICAAAAALPAAAQTGKRVGTYSDWSSYVAEQPKGKICFAASQPKAQEPKNINRDAAYFYVTTWPREGVKAEVSVKIGYPFKKGSEVKVTIGSSEFKLFTQSDRAFIADAGEERKLVEAMKKGASMQVQGTSERGTTVTDTFSLSGVSLALQALSESCQ